MPKMRFSPLLVLPTLFAWCLGCGGTFPNGMSVQTNPTTIPLAERQYEFVERGLQGEVCQVKVLGLGIGDSSYARALDELRSQVPEDLGNDYQFVNVVVDKSFEFYLLAHRVCTIVTADLVSLGDYVVVGQPPGALALQQPMGDEPPEEIAPPEPGEVPQDSFEGGALEQEAEPRAEAPQEEASVPDDPYREDDRKLEEEITESRNTYRAECDKGDGSACEKLAVMLQKGIDGPRRVTRAVVFHKKACELGVALSCAYMGKVLSRKDEKGSAKYYQKACELGATQHCPAE